MTIVPRGKKFGVSIKDPTHPKGQRWVGTFPDQATAEEEEILAKRAVKEAVAGREAGNTASNRMLVSAYADRFLSVHCAHLETTTLENYGYAVRRFVRTFGDRHMDEITRREAIDWARTCGATDMKIARRMFRMATLEDYTRSNPFDGVSRPGKSSKGRGGNRLVVVTGAQLQTLTATARESYAGPFGETMAAIVTLAAHTAMRPGEIFALKWTHLFPVKNRIHVEFSRRRDGKEKAPKNGLDRTIFVPDEALAVVMALPRVNELVFVTKSGIQFSPDTFGDAWRPVRDISRVPIVELYELRHYCATRMMEAGLSDWQVAAQMGHTDNGLLVRKTYFHPNPENILDAIGDAMRRAA